MSRFVRGFTIVWVALRSIVGSRVREDPGVFAHLMAAEELGGWVIVVPGIVLLSLVGYRPVFWAAAACCVVAVGYMASVRRLAASPAHTTGARSATDPAAPFGSIRPMLGAVAVIMMAEAAISLLLMLHLQRHFQLGPIEVAYVFLPGAIALSVLPPHLHRLTVRIGRRRMLVLGSLAGTGFAAGMAFAGSPLVIAVLWILSAASWAATIPVHQAVVTEAAGPHRIGRALSSYEAACIAGACVGVAGCGYPLRRVRLDRHLPRVGCGSSPGSSPRPRRIARHGRFGSPRTGTSGSGVGRGEGAGQGRRRCPRACRDHRTR